MPAGSGQISPRPRNEYAVDTRVTVIEAGGADLLMAARSLRIFMKMRSEERSARTRSTAIVWAQSLFSNQTPQNRSTTTRDWRHATLPIRIGHIGRLVRSVAADRLPWATMAVTIALYLRDVSQKKSGYNAVLRKAQPFQMTCSILTVVSLGSSLKSEGDLATRTTHDTTCMTSERLPACSTSSTGKGEPRWRTRGESKKPTGSKCMILSILLRRAGP